jgi:hypothetical protein
MWDAARDQKRAVKIGAYTFVVAPDHKIVATSVDDRRRTLRNIN